jgi:hypothetical protein
MNHKTKMKWFHRIPAAMCILFTLSILGCYLHTSLVEMHREECIQNLRKIEIAKEDYERNNPYKGSGPPQVPDSNINNYIEGPDPQCPSGGHYRYNLIGTDATCSKERHRLP